jgi:hypothetical protein
MESKLWRQKILDYTKSISNIKYYQKLINDNKFIIRIYERNEYKRFQFWLYFMISKQPNLARIFLTIRKDELPLLNNQKKELIDIEKYYNFNIKQKIFDKEIYRDFVKQMIYCQINLFKKDGLVHNNIHEGNIFFEDNKDNLFRESNDKIYHIYNDGVIFYNNINKTITSKTLYILSDFSKSKIYNSEYSCGIDEYDYYEISLLKNLEDTFKLGNKLFHDETIKKINIDVSKAIKNKCKNLFNDYILNYDSEKFINETMNICWNYVEPILEMIEK